MIVSGGERQVIGVLGARGGGLGWWRPWKSCFWMRDWITMGNKGSSEVGGVSVEVIRLVTDATPSNGEGVRDGTFG